MQRCLGCMQLFNEKFSICPNCGTVVGLKSKSSMALVPGAVLAERYLVGYALGTSEYGFVYMAFDTKLDRKVALKEYLPAEFVTRDLTTNSAKAYSEEKNVAFEKGKSDFFEEARKLVLFQAEEGIVSVYDAFYEHNTAYYAMEYLEGETLEQKLKREGAMPEEEALKLIKPVLKSLEKVHEYNIIHRAINPDNIIITKEGNAKLINFSAARNITSESSKSLTVMIYPGYSPMEQYYSQSSQTSATDIYSMGATIHRMLTGVYLPDAIERKRKERYETEDLFENVAKDVYITNGTKNAIINALKLSNLERTESVEDLYKQLYEEREEKLAYKKDRKSSVLIAALVAALVLVSGAIIYILLGDNTTGNITKNNINYGTYIAVPNVDGKNYEKAYEDLEKAGLNVTIVKTIETAYYEPGQVVSQSPKAGQKVNAGETISLYISAGVTEEVNPEDTTVSTPFLLGKNMLEVNDELAKYELELGAVSYEYSKIYAKNLVMSQSIDFGSEIEKGTRIDLVLSRGNENDSISNALSVTPEETIAPTEAITEEITEAATIMPTYSIVEITATPAAPTKEIVAMPTKETTKVPTKVPTKEPTKEPKNTPVATKAPTKAATATPMATATPVPTLTPTPEVKHIAVEFLYGTIISKTTSGYYSCECRKYQDTFDHEYIISGSVIDTIPIDHYYTSDCDRDKYICCMESDLPEFDGKYTIIKTPEGEQELIGQKCSCGENHFGTDCKKIADRVRGVNGDADIFKYINHHHGILSYYYEGKLVKTEEIFDYAKNVIPEIEQREEWPYPTRLPVAK